MPYLFELKSNIYRLCNDSVIALCGISTDISYLKFAVVDIETTGGHTGRNRIIEVAVFVTDGIRILDSFSSLINPGRSVPDFITSLTGIHQEMLEDAPTFEEIAGELQQILADYIFVAHNVNFDLGFIKNEFGRVNISYQPKKLCTVRLSRRILSGLRSYSLGSLCEHLNIDIRSRHRAAGDAEATVALLNHLLCKDQKGIVQQFLKANSKEATLPPNLDRNQVERLPRSPGIYYMVNGRSEVLYVGKARNIYQRVMAHFTEQSKTRSNRGLWENIYQIDFETCGNELIALILELQEIKRLWPPYNRSMKTVRMTAGIFSYTDQNGYLRLSVQSIRGKNVRPERSFYSLNDARVWLMEQIELHVLCPVLSGVYPAGKTCFAYRKGNCFGACQSEESPERYNERVLAALEANKNQESYLILGDGRDEGEKSVVLYEAGHIHGYGYVDVEFMPSDPTALTDIIQPLKQYPENQSIVRSFIERQPSGYQFIPL
jgi:DNA polymerase-3 subunit epsilon